MKNAMRALTVLAGSMVLFGSARAQDWPQWRGPNRDNKVAGFKAPTSWPKALTQKWKIDIGPGEASPVLVGDKLYVFTRKGSDEVILCLDATSGKELWKDAYGAVAVGGAAKAHPGPRSSPAVAEGKVCTLGVGGVVSCLDASSGNVVWRKNTKSWPKFYTSSSPLIADGKCIVYADALTAYDLSSGDAKWQWKGGGTPYGSPMLMTVDGVKQIVTPTTGAVAGIGLADGKPLWQVKFGSGYNDSMVTPIVDGANVIWLAQDGGSVAITIEKGQDGFTAKPLWKKGQGAHKYNTPVLHDGLLFGLSPKRTVFCMDAQSGEPLWADKTSPRGECGHILDAGPVLLVVTSDAQLVVLEPNNKEYKEIAHYPVGEKTGLDGPWSCPIIAGNRIYVRDRESLTLWTIE
jgi:outer membrane protein assembly factor BamB